MRIAITSAAGAVHDFVTRGPVGQRNRPSGRGNLAD